MKKKNKKVLFIIAFRDFKDEECFTPLEALIKKGIKVEIASDKKGTAIGAEGGELEVDHTLDELEVNDYDGVFFIGGPGALKHLDNGKSYKIARHTLKKGKLLGAICISPVILAKAGVLQGRKATVWHNALQKKPIRILEREGATVSDEKVVKDEKIITANGPAAASSFGKKILDSLS